MVKNHPFKFVNNIKLDYLHLIKADNTGSRHNCKYCSEKKSYSTNKYPKSKYYCNKCKIFLCVDCFYNYHEKNLIVRRVNSSLVNLIIQKF